MNFREAQMASQPCPRCGCSIIGTIPIGAPNGTPVFRCSQCKHEFNPAGERVQQEPPRPTTWFVESVIGGKFDGWWAGPKKGIGGWLTENPHEAKRYTEAEARAV